MGPLTQIALTGWIDLHRGKLIYGEELAKVSEKCRFESYWLHVKGLETNANIWFPALLNFLWACCLTLSGFFSIPLSLHIDKLLPFSGSESHADDSEV